MNNDEEKAANSVTEPERGFASLPSELKSQVFKNLPTTDPNETARNINSFRRINRDANKLVTETPAAKRFVGRVKRLGETAKDIYDAAIPKGALYEESADQPGGTYSHVAIGASVQGFRPLAERAELAAKVSDLSDRFGVRAEASIPLIASEHTDPKDRDDLIEDVTRSYKRNRTGYSWAETTNDELREPALYALKEAHERNHLTEEQKAKLPPGTLDRQKPEVWGIDRRITFDEGREFKARLLEDLNAAPEGEEIDRKIDKLSNKFRSLSRELPDLQNHSVDADNDRSRKFEKLDVIAKHMPESYAEALNLFRKDDPQRSSSEDRAQSSDNGHSRNRQRYGR